MKKNICVLFGTLCFMLVFGLAMNFTNCENSQKAEIRVTNSSPIAADDVITVDVLMEGRSTPVDTKEVSKNKSVTFSLDTGEYRVRVTTSTYNTYSYPQDGNVIKMSGDIRLKFNGNSLTRTN